MLPMLLPQVLYTAVARIEVGVAKAGVVVVKGEVKVEVARAKVVVALPLATSAAMLPKPPP